MRKKFLIIALTSGLAACTAPDMPRAGLSALHVPVVSQNTYVFDAAAPGGALAPGEGERLDGWFQSLGMHYGDGVYVDGGAPVARSQVASVAGTYGLLIGAGAPVTPGMVMPDSVRVIVARKEAYVPGCPDFSSPSQPNFNNQTPTNFGCGVNSAMAAQIANPEDLLHGRAAASAEDAGTAAKAIKMYRDWPLTAIQAGQILRPFKALESTTSKDK